MTWVWMAQDFSDGSLQIDELAIKFDSVEAADEFKLQFDGAKELDSEAEVQTSEDNALQPNANPDGGGQCIAGQPST